MNRRKALLNITTAIVFKVIVIVVGIVARSFLMRELGQEATGLYSLYVSILGFLSIAELGVGAAITFSMYKPIVEKDTNTVSALYYLYRKIYFSIFFIILIIGGLLTPFIPYFAKQNTGTFNIYLTYFLFLIAQLIPYTFAYKTSFINANLDNYITTAVHSSGQIIFRGLQILFLVLFKSFTLFLFAYIVGYLLEWLLTEIIFRLKYQKNLNSNKQISDEIKNEVVDKTKAMFMHKIGGTLINSVDSIIIGAFISVSILGIYTNYLVIMTGMFTVLSLIFTSITSIVGHSFAKNNKNVYYNQFKHIYFVNYFVAFVFFLGFFAVIDPVVNILFTEVSILPRDIVLILTINYFIQFMRKATLTFRDGAGLFYHDRYKPLLEGISNLILSIIFVLFWGIQGVLIATIITNLFITYTIEPYVLYKYGFERKPTNFYILNYLLTGVFALVVLILYLVPLPKIENNFYAILIYGFGSVALSLLIFSVALLFSKKLRTMVKNLFNFRKLNV
jgi:O-antigen/teichoic acid export membrane protein